jgi:23S rRNA (cytosine1962-C5)-methyltransferase
MTQHGELILAKGADRRLRTGHVWIYSNEVDTQRSPLGAFESGQQVTVLGASGKPLGTAFINPHTLICGRIISRTPERWMTASLLQQRLAAAEHMRLQRFTKPYYRLVFGDSDGLPGLVIDRFGEAAVVQISVAGMEVFKADINDILHKHHGITRVIFKNDGKMRETEGLVSLVESSDDPALGNLHLEENGVQFEVSVSAGQKTGWFYDHRLNRAALRPYVKGASVLDVFSYVGGWGIQAGAFGAASVLCVDSSAAALDLANHNARLNGLQDKVSTRCGDAFEVMRDLRENLQKFDVVIVDPPAFIPRKKDIKVGEAAYTKLNLLALQLLNPGGLLVSASCSMHLQRESLVDIIRGTARQTDRFVQIVEQGHQGPDHPILPSVPETDYIKAFFVRSLLSL